MARPAISPHFVVEVVAPDCVYLLSESRHVVLRGRAYASVVPLLDGSRSIEQISAALSGQLSVSAVRLLVGRLSIKGLISDGSERDERAAYLSMVGVGSAQAQARADAAIVALRAVGHCDVTPLRSALGALGLRCVEVASPAAPAPAAPATLTVVATDDYLRGELAAINSEMLARRAPWMLFKPRGGVLWFGPIFEPGHSACWRCLAQRLRGNRRVETMLEARGTTRAPLSVSRAALPTTIGAASSIAAGEVLSWLCAAGGVADGTPAETREDGERTGGLRGRVWTLDLVSGHSRNHPLTRRPQCADCGAGAGTREQQPLVLEPRPARFGADGGLRIEPPAATERRLARHVSPITGVVHDIVAVHTDAPISCFAATHQQGAAVDFDSLRRMNRWASAGKGVSPAQARASALCEALERYAGIFDGEEPRRRARLDALGHEAIGPDELLLFSARQYAARAEQPTRDPLKARWVPAPFDRQQPISWTRAWSLTDGAFRYLPTAFCYYGFHDDDLAPFCYADSNGNAAGNCVEEAILQGLFELVERDAVALWWYSRARRPALDLERFDEPSALALQRYYERRGGSMWVLDVTSDLGIAVFVAVARDAQGRFALGMGAHVNARLALTRAVSELGQVASAFEATRALPPELADDVFERWHDQLEPRSQPQLLPDASAPPRTRADVPSTPDYGDLREGVLDCVERLRARGLQMLVLELTRPDIDLAVVKVVVPGLRHMWPRLAAGRLYDVPVALGWIDEPLAEEALNPLPLII